MKNVTVTLDEEIARWARVEAAKAGKSLSRWISDRLEREKEAGTPERDARGCARTLHSRSRLAGNSATSADAG